MSKTTYHSGDTVWYFAVDPDTDPSGWIKECEVLDDMFPLDIYTITDKQFAVPISIQCKWMAAIQNRESCSYTLPEMG